MDIKIISSVAALALCGAVSSGYAQTSVDSRQTTIEESKTVVDVPKPANSVKEETTTTTRSKKGLFGRKKETTTSTSRVDREPDPTATAEVRSRTTVETERRSRDY